MINKFFNFLLLIALSCDPLMAETITLYPSNHLVQYGDGLKKEKDYSGLPIIIETSEHDDYVYFGIERKDKENSTTILVNGSSKYKYNGYIKGIQNSINKNQRMGELIKADDTYYEIYYEYRIDSEIRTHYMFITIYELGGFDFLMINDMTFREETLSTRTIILCKINNEQKQKIRSLLDYYIPKTAFPLK